MERIISLFVRVFSLTNRIYWLSFPGSSVLANEFFNGTLPREVAIPADLKGSSNERYKVQRIELSYYDRRIRLFYTISRNGLLGQMYAEGINLNTGDTSFTVLLSRGTFLHKLVACGESFNCVVGVLGDLERDCRTFKDSTNCWYCRQITHDSRDDDCPWLD
jgi:hypothetical protein